MSAADYLSSMQSKASANYGIPASDPGSAFGRQSTAGAGLIDTSSVFNGSSDQQYSTWRVHKGPGERVLAPKAGQGNFFQDTDSSSQVPQPMG